MEEQERFLAHFLPRNAIGLILNFAKVLGRQPAPDAPPHTHTHFRRQCSERPRIYCEYNKLCLPLWLCSYVGQKQGTGTEGCLAQTGGTSTRRNVLIPLAIAGVHTGFFNGRGTGFKAVMGPKVTLPKKRKLLEFGPLFFWWALIFILLLLFISYFIIPIFASYGGGGHGPACPPLVCALV